MSSLCVTNEDLHRPNIKISAATMPTHNPASGTQAPQARLASNEHSAISSVVSTYELTEKRDRNVALLLELIRRQQNARDEGSYDGSIVIGKQSLGATPLGKSARHAEDEDNLGAQNPPEIVNKDQQPKVPRTADRNGRRTLQGDTTGRTAEQPHKTLHGYARSAQKVGGAQGMQHRTAMGGDESTNGTLDDTGAYLRTTHGVSDGLAGYTGTEYGKASLRSPKMK